MIKGFSTLILILFLQVRQCTLQRRICPTSIIKIDDELLLLSDIQASAKILRDRCSDAGSEFFQISNDAIRQQLMNLLRRKFIRNDNFAYVTIHQNPNHDNVFKYRSNSGSRDPENIDDWLIPPEGRLRSFIMYKKPTPSFNRAHTFCYAGGRGLLLTVCGNGWTFNFQLYGGTSSTAQAIPLFIYYNNAPYLLDTNLFLNDNVNMPFLVKQPNPNALYIPDISVFIGARYNRKNWFWNNGTNVTDQRFRDFTGRNCQQMTWPLTYDDGINLRSILCGKEAYAFCKFDFNISVSPIQCNGSILMVSWNQPGLENITSEARNLYVVIQVKNDFRVVVPMSNKRALIHDLTQSTKYNVKATLIYGNCNIPNRRISISASASQTTFFGLPEPVENPVAKNSTDETFPCQIEWTYNKSYIQEMITYQITVKSQNTSYTYNISNEDLSSSGQSNFLLNVNTSQAPKEEMLELKIQLFSCQGGSEISTAAGTCLIQVNSIQEPTANDSIIITVVIIILVFIVILAAVAWFFYKRKRKIFDEPQTRKPEELLKYNNIACVNQEVDINDQTFQPSSNQAPDYSNEDVYENIQEANSGSAMDDLAKLFLNDSSNNFEIIRKEFSKIAKTSSKQELDHNIASHPDNAKKNRYKNIYPYDHARVQLEGQRYINASYIDGSLSNRKFIASQGPKPTTVNDFWEMVWKENSTLIVMLCKCVEMGKKKCEPYWPLTKSTSSYGIFDVKSLSEENQGGIIKRTFIFRKQDLNGLDRTVVQFHFTSWPDHDIPLTTSGMIRLRNMVNEEHKKRTNDGRIIIHCSAGAGRTGTYIAIDNLVEKYQSTGGIDIFAAVMEMRKNRKQMIQTASQYIYVHKVLLESIALPKTDKTTKALSQIMSKENWIEIVFKEYSKLSTLRFVDHKSEEECVYENCSPKILSNEVNRVEILENNQKLKSMDAHFIENERFPFWLIASSGIKNRSNFLDMILQRNVKMVVCLEYLEHDLIVSDCNKAGDAFSIDQYKLKFNHIADCNTYKIMKLSILEAYQTKVDFNFSLVFISSWQNTFSPPGAECLADVINRILSFMESSENASALVYCRDGCSRTGIFLVFADLLQQLKQSQSIDVFRSVKDLQDLRPGSIANLEIYQICYKLIDDYINSNPEYMSEK